MGQQTTYKHILAKDILYDYSSVLVELPKILATKILLWGKDNIKDDDLYQPNDGTHGREDSIHITVIYGIYSQEPQKLFKLLQYQPPFEIELGKVSLFSNEYFNVVKIEAFSPVLFYLNKFLEANIYNKKSIFLYKPHVTIAYTKRFSDVRLKDIGFFEGITWTANSLNFSSRNGTKARIRLDNSLMPVKC
jgi:hypothetical protein